MKTAMDYRTNLAYRRAKKRMKNIKGFYIHLLVYLFINTAIIAVDIQDERISETLSDPGTFFTPIFWGIGLAGHWFAVFGPDVIFGKDWEQRQIKKLMNKQKRQTWE